MENSPVCGNFMKINIIDILIILLIIGAAAGLVYRQTSPDLRRIFAAEEQFTIVFFADELTEETLDFINIGDSMFRQHARHQAIGTVASIDINPAVSIVHMPDGTAKTAEIEGLYSALIEISMTGSRTERGFFVNGVDHIAPGSVVTLVSTNVFLFETTVRSISER